MHVRTILHLAFLLMGFSFSATQALMARELLVGFTGNELSIGLVLGNWLALEALGSGVVGRLAGRWRTGGPAYAALQVALAVILPLSLYGAMTVRRLIGVVLGEGVGPGAMLWSAALVLAPLGVVDGAMFAFGCQAYNRAVEARARSGSRVYVLEAVGGIVGGLVFTYVFIPYLQPVQMVLVLAGLNLASAVSILVAIGRSGGNRRPWVRLGGVVALLVVVAVWLLPANAERVQRWLVGQQWSPHDVVGYRNSIYGNLAAIQSQGQYTFFANGIPVLTASVPDTVLVEEIVHLPLLFREPPRRALVVGGGVGGLLHELLKYPVQVVDYAEPDPALIQMVREFPTRLTQGELADPRVQVHHVDGVLLVQQISDRAAGQYDLMVANLPYPSTLQLNRMYTEDFLRTARAVLADEGLLVMTAPGAEAYMSPGLRDLNAAVYDSLARTFPHLYAIPGEVNLWLASPGLDLAGMSLAELEGRWEEQSVAVHVVGGDYIRYKLQPERVRWFWESLQGGAAVKRNRALHPSGLLYGLRYWSEQFSPGLSGYLAGLSRLRLNHLAGAVVALILLVAVLRRGRSTRVTVGFAVGTTGFAGMAFDLVVIFAFQTLYGHVYQQIGLLVMAFMAGLSLGGWWMGRWLGKGLSGEKESRTLRQALVRLEAGTAAYLAAFPLALALMHARAAGPGEWAGVRMALLGLNAGAGLLVGLEFPLANVVYQETGTLYAADLAGACVGAVAVAAALMPALGIVETCALLAMLKAGSMALVGTMGRWQDGEPGKGSKRGAAGSQRAQRHVGEGQRGDAGYGPGW